MRFEKVSKEEFKKTIKKLYPYVDEKERDVIYEDIKLPKRATKCSAGYDFYSPIGFRLMAGKTELIPTGIKVALDDDKFLMMCPRSGLGFKFRIQLDNTVGIIDADYIQSDNEGHIMIKLTNDSRENKDVYIEPGDAIAQGIILQYFKTENDDVVAERNGGFGSTSKKQQPLSEERC